MQTPRLIFATAVTLLLAGCSDEAAENSRLRHEIAELRQHLATRTAERSAEIAYHNRQAAIAAGCDWVVPICPATIAEPGRRAQAAGYGGGDSSLFWGILLLKTLTAATGLGGLAITILLGSDWLLRPSRAQTDKARKLVDQARADALRITTAAERELLAKSQAIHDAGEELAELLAEIEETQSELDRQKALLERKQQNLTAVEEARRALDSI